MCCRVGEVKALRWKNYAPDRKTIFIHAEVEPRNGVHTLLEHTKAAEYGNRTQFLPDDAYEILNHLMPDAADPEEVIFRTETGMFLRTNTFNRTLKRLCDWTGIKYQSSHKIRFWSVTAMARTTGRDITAVGRYAGQVCQQTTLHYIRKAQDEDVQREAAAKIFCRQTA